MEPEGEACDIQRNDCGAPLFGGRIAGKIVRSLYDHPYSGIEEELSASGISKGNARALWKALYRNESSSLHSQELPPALLRWMEERCAASIVRAACIESADGLARKFLLRLRDGREVECVTMTFAGRFTACLSTQAGCAMGCVFCATGQMGFGRHLTAGEIVEQVLHCHRDLRERGLPGLRNLVLMGMGEPLHNYDAVMEALAIVTDRRGLNIGPSHVTISTVGVIPGILRMAEERRPYHLAVSLHGANEADRAALVPANRRWPLAALIDACRSYQAQTGRKIFFEWTLIHDVNDSDAVASELAALFTGLRAHVNLIPLNPTHGYDATASSAARSFQGILRERGIPSTIRQRRGIDVGAGCGQLAGEPTIRSRPLTSLFPTG